MGRRRGFLGWLLGGDAPVDAPPGEPAAPTPGGTPAVPFAASARGSDASPGDGAPTEGLSVEPAPRQPAVTPDEDSLFDEVPVFVPPPTRAVPGPPAPQPARAAPLRPPGALPEGAFEEACTRCGLCVEACPPSAIVVKGGDPFPRLVPAVTPCELCPDLPCVRSCPTGALRPLPVTAVRIGTARVHTRLCLNGAAPGSCDHCLDQCPVPGALTPGPSGIPAVAEELCVGCGLCARHCRGGAGAGGGGRAPPGPPRGGGRAPGCARRRGRSP